MINDFNLVFNNAFKLSVLSYFCFRIKLLIITTLIFLPPVEDFFINVAKFFERKWVLYFIIIYYKKLQTPALLYYKHIYLIIINTYQTYVYLEIIKRLIVNIDRSNDSKN